MGPSIFNHLFYTATSVLVAVVFVYLYRLKGREYFLWWTWGWVFETVRAMAELAHESAAPLSLIGTMAFPLGATSLALSSFLFLLGTRQLCGGRLWWRPLTGGLVFVAVWSMASPAFSTRPVWTVVPGVLLSTGIMGAIGYCLLGSAARRPVYGGRILGVLFLARGLHLLVYPLEYAHLGVGVYWEYLWSIRFAISSLMSLSIAIFMIVFLIEETGTTLRKTEERFRRIFLEASECILMADPDTGKIVGANPRAQDLSGYSFEELEDIPLSSVLIDSESATGERDTGRWVPGGNYPKSAIMEMELRHHDGRTIPVSVTRTLIEQAEGSRLVQIHLRDETESRRSQADLRVQFERVRALHQISMALSKALDGNRIFQIVFDQVRLILPLDVFVIDLYRAEENVLETAFRSERIGPSFRQGGVGARRAPSRILFETVVRDRQPILENLGISQDTEPSPEDSEITPSSSRPGSRMFVPMVASDEVLGVLSIQSNSPSSYDSSMLDLFQNLGNLTATAVGNSNLFFREHEHSERMRFLKDLGQALAGWLELGPKLETAQNLIAEFLRTDGATVYLYDDEREALVSAGRLRRSSGSDSPSPSEAEEEEIPSTVLSCFSTGQPVVESSPPSGTERAMVGGRPVLSSVAVPVTMRGRPIGVLRIDDCRVAGRFGRSDVEFLLLVVKQLATAVENARAYENLRQSRDHFSALVEHSPEGVAVFRNGRIVYANQALRTLLNQETLPFTPHPPAEFVEPDDLTAFEDRIQRVLREKVTLRSEITLIRQDGGQRHCEVELAPLLWEREPGVMALFTDRATSYSIPGTPRTDVHIHALQTLLAGIAGDFSSVFSAILGQTSFLKIQLPPGESITRSIESIEETTLRASEYVKQILGLRENLVTDLIVVDFSVLMRNLLDEFSEIRQGRFSFALETAKDLRKVRLPRSLFHLAAMGLLNAVAETFPRDTPVRVRLRNRNWSSGLGKQLRELPRGNYVEIRMVPQDAEVTPRDLTRIVHPFDQSGAEGQAFGLPFSLGLLRLMGAALAITKTTQGKAAISLLLPAFTEEDPTTRDIIVSDDSPLPLATPNPSRYELTGEVVILTEDDPV